MEVMILEGFPKGRTNRKAGHKMKKTGSWKKAMKDCGGKGLTGRGVILCAKAHYKKKPHAKKRHHRRRR